MREAEGEIENEMQEIITTIENHTHRSDCNVVLCEVKFRVYCTVVWCVCGERRMIYIQ